MLVLPHDAELWFQRREGVIGDFRPRMADRGEEGRFAGVGQPDKTGVGDQLQAQPDPSLAARPAGIGAARRAIGRALVMRIAEPAVAALQKDEPLAGTGEISEHQAVIFIHDLGADRNPQNQIFAVGAGPLAAGTGPAVLRPKMLPISVIDQRIEVLGRDKDDVAAFAAIAAVRPAELDKLFAAKAHRAAPAVTALQVDLALIEELHVHKLKGEQPGRSPLAPSSSGNGYSAASAGGGAGGTTDT